MKAYRKSNELGINYNLFFLGEPSKKIQNILDAIKALNSIEKIE